jgi:hypothetical protein
MVATTNITTMVPAERIITTLTVSDVEGVGNVEIKMTLLGLGTKNQCDQ